MTVEVICHTDHRPEGTGPGAVVATFQDWQSASNRDIAESYPLCDLETREVPRPVVVEKGTEG